MPDFRMAGDILTTDMKLPIMPTRFTRSPLDLSLLTPNVVELAQAIYNDRASNRMGELTDALVKAGCDNEEVLSHCRGPGPHVRGC